jgi:hypothetical protein
MKKLSRILGSAVPVRVEVGNSALINLLVGDEVEIKMHGIPVARLSYDLLPFDRVDFKWDWPFPPSCLSQ